MNAATYANTAVSGSAPPVMDWTPAAYQQICRRWLRHKSLVAAGPLCSAAALQHTCAAKTSTETATRYIPCPLCNSDGYRVFHPQTTRGYAVAQCAACGFLYRNPTYQPAALADAYNQGYLGFLEGGYSQDRRALYRRALDQLAFGRQTAGFERRRLLDVGCGHGLFLTVARDLGWEPYGLDFASDCIRHARSVFGLPNVAVGNLAPHSFQPGFFDAVTLWSVVAHLDDPLSMFKNINRVLRPGGILIIYTVNAASIGHRRRLADWGGFHKNHIVFFSLDLLAGALSQSGFGNIKAVADTRQLDAAIASGSIQAEHQLYFINLFAQQSLGMLLVSACRSPGAHSSYTCYRSSP